MLSKTSQTIGLGDAPDQNQDNKVGSVKVAGTQGLGQQDGGSICDGVCDRLVDMA